jgi:sugar phosphate isomerase/epimerase
LAEPLTRRRFLGAALAFAAAGAGCARQEPKTRVPERLALSYGGFALGLQSYTLRRFTLDQALDAAHDLGLAQMELIPELHLGPFDLGSHFPVVAESGPIADVRRRCAARGIEIAAHGVNAVPDAVSGAHLFLFAEKAKIPILTISPELGVLSELDSLCDAHPSVRLAIHNHGPHLAWEGVEEIASALEHRNPRFGACVDTGHYIRSGIDPVAAIRRLGPRVHAVHLKDFVGPGFFAKGCVLGDGKLDLPGVFAALREVDFRGALSLEYEENPDDPLPDVSACLRAASRAASAP